MTPRPNRAWASAGLACHGFSEGFLAIGEFSLDEILFDQRGFGSGLERRRPTLR